jgi:tetratricopeptide (TPR) repeat protein
VVHPIAGSKYLMFAPDTNPRWRWLIFLGIFLAAAALVLSAARHALAAHWARSADAGIWVRAAETEPTNDDVWHQLGRYYQLDFEHSDLRLAISYYQRAISINPGSSLYWLDLASAYEAAGNVSQAEQALRKAREAYPASAEAAWRFGNFLLRQRRTSEAFRQIHDAIMADPKLTPLALSRCWADTQDIGEILNTVLPDKPDQNWGATQFFVEAREPAAAMAVWRRVVSGRISFPLARTFPLLDMLIQTGHADDAQTVWKQALLAAGLASNSDSAGSLVTNGGFERELLNGGFDWRVVPVEGAKITWDEQIFHTGRRSLRVDFNGTANVDFHNVRQYLIVQPATRYRFRAFFRGEQLTTDSGMHFEIRDVSRPGNPSRLTPNVLGTQAWTEEAIEMETGPDTRILELTLRRAPSEKLANKIQGTAWIDDVALVPSLASASAPR